MLKNSAFVSFILSLRVTRLKQVYAINILAHFNSVLYYGIKVCDNKNMVGCLALDSKNALGAAFSKSTPTQVSVNGDILKEFASISMKYTKNGFNNKKSLY